MMDRARPGLALFPASFDPVTNGHLDLVHRARRVFPDLVVAVAHNMAKLGTFPVEERVEMPQSAVDDLWRVTAFEAWLWLRPESFRGGDSRLRANALVSSRWR
jgi:cytidyltransferase-like protein